MEAKKSNKKLIAILVAVVVVIVAVAAVAYVNLTPKATAGAKTVTVTVIDADAAETVYTVNTDAEYLLAVLDEAEGLTYDGYESDWGYYITTVNGLYADYSVDCSYWSIYVNGDYGMYSVDAQVVEDGDAFTLSYEVYAY